VKSTGACVENDNLIFEWDKRGKTLLVVPGWRMKTNRVVHWLIAAAFTASWPVEAGAMSGHQMGGFAGGGFHGTSGHGFGHPFGLGHEFRDHRFVGRDFHNHFFRHHRFFFGFDVVAFGFPYWWYPDFYYGYPSGYADYDSSPIYDYRYWAGLATAVQTELARRGFYHGTIDGAVGPGSREAIRAFQEAQGLPVTGLINPPLLKALKLPAVP
jgi:hypothetical protein